MKKERLIPVLYRVSKEQKNKVKKKSNEEKKQGREISESGVIRNLIHNMK